MEIVILTDYDASGNMYSLASGVNRYTNHHATTVKLRVHPEMMFPSMTVANDKNMSHIRKKIYDADAVIFKEFWWIPEKFGLDMNKLKRKQKAVIMGGGGFRFEKNRDENIKFFTGHNIKIATSSADFLQHRKMSWIPPCIRYEEIREKYDMTKAVPPLIFASPSKDTDLRLDLRKQFLNIMNKLSQEELRFSSLCVGGTRKTVTNDRCLELKAKASIFFDRIYDIYGVNSQEAGAFEEAIVTGTNDFTIKKLRDFGFNCPFIIVKNYIQMKNEIKKLLLNETYLTNKAEACRKYVEKLHSGKESAKRLIELLES